MGKPSLSGQLFSQKPVGHARLDLRAVQLHEGTHGLAKLFFGEGIGGE